MFSRSVFSGKRCSPGKELDVIFLEQIDDSICEFFYNIILAAHHDCKIKFRWRYVYSMLGKFIPR